MTLGLVQDVQLYGLAGVGARHEKTRCSWRENSSAGLPYFLCPWHAKAAGVAMHG